MNTREWFPFKRSVRVAGRTGSGRQLLTKASWHSRPVAVAVDTCSAKFNHQQPVNKWIAYFSSSFSLPLALNRCNNLPYHLTFSRLNGHLTLGQTHRERQLT